MNHIFQRRQAAIKIFPHSYADLHNHTTASDGDFSPEELVVEAKKAGISALGVTDHDTIKGIEQALATGNRHKIEVVPGVEISVRFKRPFFTGTLHLLCYFSETLFRNEKFQLSIMETLGMGRGLSLVIQRVNAINHFFGPEGTTPLLKKELTPEEINLFSANASRRHFAMALNQNHAILDPDMVNSIINNKSPAYLPSGIDLDIVKNFMEKFPMLAVLAHPAAGSFPGKGHYREVLPPVEIVEQLLPDFLDAGLGGIEINYPGHIREHREILRSWADRHNLIATGGSDCHDAVNRPIGVAGISKEEFELFKARIPLFPSRP